MITENTFGAADIAVVVVYFLVVMSTGIYAMCSSKRDTAAGYFLAGRFMTFLPIGASLFASNIGSEHFIGLSGSGAAAGIGVSAFELNSMITLQVLGWVFLPVYISCGVTTMPEYVQKRFGGRRILVYLSVTSLVMYILTKMSVNMYSGSLFIKAALNWDLAPALTLIIALTAFCTVTGGLAAVIYTDTIQAFLMCFGGLILTGYAFAEVGGMSELYQRYMASHPSNLTGVPEGCGEPRPDSLQLLRDPIDSDLPWPGFIFGFSAPSIWYWCTDQVIVQRALAAKSLSHAQGGTLVAGYLKALPMFTLVMPGMISRVLYPDEVACANPDVCEQFCGNRAGCSDMAYPKLIMELMPVGLRGLMVAIMLAALVTDLTSIFNSSSSIFTLDVYPFFRKSPSNREQMIVGRLFVVVMTVCSILWIPIIQSTQGAQLYIYIQAMLAYLSPPLAAVFLLAILWPRANEQGAFWSLMAGLVTGGIRMAIELAFKAPSCGEPETRPAILLKVHYMYFALILFVQTAVVMMAVSLLTKPPENWRTVRTVFRRRFDSTVRPDELSTPLKDSNSKAAHTDSAVIEKQEDVVKPRKDADGVRHRSFLDRIGLPSTIDPKTGQKKSRSQMAKCWLIVLSSWFCGFSLDESSSTTKEVPKFGQREDEVGENIAKLIATIQQNDQTRFLLGCNLVFIVALSLFLIVFFSLPL